MNKFTLSVVISSILSSNAYTGIYSGLNVGINSVNVYKDLFYPARVLTHSSFSNAYTNFHGQFLVGYEFDLNATVSAAIEGDADLFTGRSQYTINPWFFDKTVYAEEKLKYGFSLFLIPSYHYNESLSFFVGPGLSYTRLDIATPNSAGNVGISDNFSRWLTGAGFKLGTLTQLKNNLDLLVTYQFTQYESFKRSQIEPYTTENLRAHYKLKTNIVLIGLRKRF